MTDSLPATDALGVARELILRPGGLDDARLDQVFGEVLRHRVDFADCRPVKVRVAPPRLAMDRLSR